ncbi:MAG: hypothetical protein ACTHJ5_13260 [Ilyomonas sp.]
MEDLIEIEKIKRMAADLANIASSNFFLKEIMNVKRTSETENRLQKAKNFANIEYIKSYAIEVPADFRITTRNFESPFDTSKKKHEKEVRVLNGHGFGTVMLGDITINVVPKKQEELTREPSDQESIMNVVKKTILEISEFISKKNFKALLEELFSIPTHEDRKKFVYDVLMNSQELRTRGIIVPESLNIQRSYFFDGRLTLFCISKIVEEAFPWRKITLTFDSAPNTTLHNVQQGNADSK